MGTPLGPKYIPYAYMDPLGFQIYPCLPMLRLGARRAWERCDSSKALQLLSFGIMENKMETTTAYWG